MFQKLSKKYFYYTYLVKIKENEYSTFDYAVLILYILILGSPGNLSLLVQLHGTK